MWRSKLAVLLLAVVCCLPADGAARRKPKRRVPASRPVSLEVQPAPEIDTRVADEVARARQILDELSADNVLVSPYLVSAVYYHDGFLSAFPVERNTAAPERRIIGQIGNAMSAERKARFMGLLHELWTRSETPSAAPPVEPVVYSAAAGGRRTHKYAIDLFAHEGAPVRAVSRGIVVLADHDWTAEDLFSTTSRKGGNAVILFDPDRDRFYRYCHMGAVEVSPGRIVAAGDPLGTVGHTGLNASRPGHGGHLHFEANEYLDGKVKAMDNRHLRALLRQWRTGTNPPETPKKTSNRHKKHR